jgi:hypothetical protein
VTFSFINSNVLTHIFLQASHLVLGSAEHDLSPCQAKPHSDTLEEEKLPHLLGTAYPERLHTSAVAQTILETMSHTLGLDNKMHPQNIPQ